MDIKVPQALGVADKFGKGSGGLGVIDIPLLPEACHREMIFDREQHELAALVRNAETLQQGTSEANAAFGMALDGFGLADVVEQECEIQQRWIGAFVEGGAILEGDGFGLGEHAVEFADRAERMHIGGVAMVILVLDQAGEAVEFRDETAQHTQLVHLGEGGMDRAHFGEDGTETDAGVGRTRDLGRQAGELGADELREMKIERGVELLAVAKHPEEAHGIRAEDIGILRGEFPSAEDETIEAFGTGETRRAEPFAKRPAALAVGTAAADAQREPILDELRHAEHRLRRAVIILHEVLHPGQHFDLGVTEVLRDARLEIEIHDIRRAGAHEMEVVADPQEKVVAPVECGEVLGAQVVLRGELVEGRDAQLHAGHPHGVLVVAEAADAILDVGLLIEDGVGEFRAAARLVVQSRGDVALGVFADVVAAVGLRKRIVEFG